MPYVRGGVEIFTDELVGQLRARGHEADVVTVPWQGWPNERLLTNAFAWRTLDLASACEPPPELVIATKFPSYMITHPNKVTWLVHQYRQAYELDGTAFGQLSESREDREIRRRIQLMDQASLRESAQALRDLRERRPAAGRLDRARGGGSPASALRPALPLRGIRTLRALGRPPRDDQTRRAADRGRDRRATQLAVVVAGDGPRARAPRGPRLRRLPESRLRFVGHVSESELADLYARCRAVFYAPLDEDFGMVPFEAFASGKPVVTTTDAGGPLEVVRDGKNGIVVEATAEALARALRSLLDDEQRARELGGNGLASAALR